MITEEQQTQIELSVKNLIPCREEAYKNGSELKIIHSNSRYWDLLSFYKGNWHYITTLKLK